MSYFIEVQCIECMLRSKSECSRAGIPKIVSFLVIVTILAMLPTILVTTPFVYAEEENGSEAMSEMDDESSDLISPITEWIGVGVLGITAGLVIPLNVLSKRGIKNNSSESIGTKTYLVTLTGLLSIAVGIIHLLLVKEHMEESYLWGVGFLAMGVPQIVYGLVIIFSKMLPTSWRKILYKVGILGNALFVTIFVYVRLFVPPFSPEGTPVSELEPNGILTVVIQLLIVAMLVYVGKEKKIKEQEIPMVTKR
jgi:hypothetical protein